MSPVPPQIFQLADLCVELARGAAAVIRDRTARPQQILAKSTDTDLVTETDRAAEDWLVTRIAQARPDDAILGEEGGGRPGTSGVRWVVDPIDGTVNFVLGLPQYAVSVAAELEGEVVAGAVLNVVTGELFHAARGAGAQLTTERGSEGLTGPREVPMARAVVGTGFGYEAGRRSRQIAVVAQLLPRIADIRRLGAASLDLCAVAAGRLDAYFEVGLNPWDYAAGALIAAEAGCAVAGPAGGPPAPELTVVARPDMLPELMAALTEFGIESVF